MTGVQTCALPICKLRHTGGKRKIHRKKRKYELARVPSNTKLPANAKDIRIRTIRVKGGALKRRALRINSGQFSWKSETITKPTRVLEVSYNATSNELVRTKTLVKGAVVSIDASPFKAWFAKYYGITLGKKKDKKDDIKVSRAQKSRVSQRLQAGDKDPYRKDLIRQFSSGKLLARLSARPGQVGALGGYILEGPELHFYQRKMDKKKAKK